MRRSSDRRYEGRRDREVWLTFYRYGPGDPLAGGFGGLRSLSEAWIGPEAAVLPLHGLPAEIITYVREGQLLHDDPGGRPCMIDAGEFHQAVSDPEAPCLGLNVSPTEGAHTFQITFRPSRVGARLSSEKVRFAGDERQGRMCVAASFEECTGALLLMQDARIFTAVLERSQHVNHALTVGRGAWLHVVDGSVAVDGVLLATGDGAGVTGDGVDITARTPTELLLIDVGMEYNELR